MNFDIKNLQFSKKTMNFEIKNYDHIYYCQKFAKKFPKKSLYFSRAWSKLFVYFESILRVVQWGVLGSYAPIYTVIPFHGNISFSLTQLFIIWILDKPII